MDLRLLSPVSITEAKDALAFGNARVLAGGTDLLVSLRNKTLSCDTLVDIKRIEALRQIEVDGEIRIGAAVSLRQLLLCEALPRGAQLLKEAAAHLATPSLRNRATLLGNLCNASPGGDMAGVSLVLSGEIEAVSASEGTRRIPLSDFFKGVKQTVLGPDELATHLVFPMPDGYGRYFKSQRVRGHDLAQVGVAVYAQKDGAVKVAVTAAAATPILVDDLPRLSQLQSEQAVAHVLSRISPITDQRATKEYRLHMVSTYLKMALDVLREEVNA